MTPELKSPSVAMPFNGFTQEAYAKKMIDEYRAAGVSPRDVFPQSFDQRDVLYWIRNAPAFGRQAVYLDDAEVPAHLPGDAELAAYKRMGINIVGPPTFALLDVDVNNRLIPSDDACNARRPVSTSSPGRSNVQESWPTATTGSISRPSTRRSPATGTS